MSGLSERHVTVRAYELKAGDCAWILGEWRTIVKVEDIGPGVRFYVQGINRPFALRNPMCVRILSGAK